MQKTPVAVFGVVMTSGVAHAQLSYTQDSFTRLGYRTNVNIAGSPVYNGGTGYVAQDLGGFFTDDLQNFTFTQPIDASDYPGISNFIQDYSVTSQAASSRFELSWSGLQQFQPVSPIADPDLVAASLIVDARLTMHVHQDTQLRFAWSGAANQVTDDLPDGHANSFEIQVHTLNGSVIPFNAGLGDPDNSISAPFDFVIDVSAGEEITLFIDMSFRGTTIAGGDAGNGWDLYQNSSFVIEIVPAPSTLALLGLGGLVATRRRR